jgi:hypothetical protein
MRHHVWRDICGWCWTLRDEDGRLLAQGGGMPCFKAAERAVRDAIRTATLQEVWH